MPQGQLVLFVTECIFHCSVEVVLIGSLANDIVVFFFTRFVCGHNTPIDMKIFIRI